MRHACAVSPPLSEINHVSAVTCKIGAARIDPCIPLYAIGMHMQTDKDWVVSYTPSRGLICAHELNFSLESLGTQVQFRV